MNMNTNIKIVWKKIKKQFSSLPCTLLIFAQNVLFLPEYAFRVQFSLDWLKIKVYIILFVLLLQCILLHPYLLIRLAWRREGNYFLFSILLDSGRQTTIWILLQQEIVWKGKRSKVIFMIMKLSCQSLSSKWMFLSFFMNCSTHHLNWNKSEWNDLTKSGV